MVRIQDSQSWHRGSIPLSTTESAAKTAALFLYDIGNTIQQANTLDNSRHQSKVLQTNLTLP